MAKKPIDTPQRKIGSRAVAIVHYKVNTDHWEFRQETGNDVGRDCILELSDNSEWTNHKIEGQIKGTLRPNILKNSEVISFPLEVKTINYALSSSCPFVLFLVDVEGEMVYYLPIQDYFIDNPQLFEKLDSEQKTLNVLIPMNKVLNFDDGDLISIARGVYLDGPGISIKKHISENSFTK